MLCENVGETNPDIAGLGVCARYFLFSLTTSDKIDIYCIRIPSRNFSHFIYLLYDTMERCHSCSF